MQKHMNMKPAPARESDVSNVKRNKATAVTRKKNKAEAQTGAVFNDGRLAATTCN
jgi:hypothetical protein